MKPAGCARPVFRLLLRRMLAGCLAWLWLAPPLPARADEAIRIGILSYRPIQESRQLWAPTGAWLESRLPGRRFAIEPLYFGELAKAVAERRVDFVLTNPEHFVLLRADHGLTAISTLMPIAGGHPVNSFGGVIFTRADRRDIERLEDIAGKHISAVSRESMGGYLAQHWTLVKAGVDPLREARLSFTGMPHENVLHAVLAGRADVGFMRTGILEEAIGQGKIDAAAVRVLNPRPDAGFPQMLSTDLYPEWPFAAMPGVAPPTKKAVALALLDMRPDAPAAVRGGYYGFAPPADYAGVEALMARLGLISHRGEFGWRDVLERYAPWIVGALLLVVAAMVQAARQLRRSNRALGRALVQTNELAQQRSQLLASLGEGVYGIDRAGNCTFINAAALALLGYELKEVVGRDQHALFHHHRPDGTPYPVEECPVHRALRDGERCDAPEETFIRKSGEPLPVQLTATPVKELDATVGAVVVFQDITERKLAERRFRESEQRLHALIDASPESTLLLDPEGKVLAINATGAGRFGRTPQEMAGIDFFGLIPPDLAASRRGYLRQVVDLGLPLHVSDRRGAIEFENSLFPVKDDAGVVRAVAVYAQDVTEKRLNERVEAMFQRLDQMAVKWGMDPGSIVQAFCDEFRPMFDLSAVWLGRAEEDGTLTWIGEAGSGDGAFLGQVRASCRRWRGDPACCVPAGHVLRSGQPQKLTADRLEMAGCRAAAQAAGIQAALILPLTLHDRNWGVLACYARDRDRFERAETGPRLIGIVNRLCVSLDLALQQEWLALLETALTTAGNAVFITDAEGRLLWANPSLERLSGYARSEILGRTPKIFSSGEHGADFYRSFWETIRAGETWRGEVVNARPDGSRYTVSQTVTPLRNASGAVGHYVSILEDVSERKSSEARIWHMANYDMLTDLPNRAMFMERLAQSLALARRDGRSGALLYLDLDRFKEVNDRLGHDIGDLLLKAVADRLRALVRETDIIARLGGDEFTVTLPNVDGADDAIRVADKIIAAISRSFDLKGCEVSIGVSIGIALFPDHGDDVGRIVNAADGAMYEAKRAGRNTARVFQGAGAA